jgi:hypothetical protein
MKVQSATSEPSMHFCNVSRMLYRKGHQPDAFSQSAAIDPSCVVGMSFNRQLPSINTHTDDVGLESPPVVYPNTHFPEPVKWINHSGRSRLKPGKRHSPRWRFGRFGRKKPQVFFNYRDLSIPTNYILAFHAALSALSQFSFSADTI